ncbi:hypothetical protein BG004_001381 [Podila humilis]|nr:hypothetical protein BG004_001381 [Podila humilis]
MRDHVQRTPHPPSNDYVTLSYYQFRPIDTKDLLKIQYYFLKDLRAMDIVGRIYVSAEGINAQISCPKERVEEFKKYYSSHWPIFDKIRFNLAMTEGKAFKKLHVRIKGQLVADGIDNRTFDLSNEPTYLSPEEWHNELSSLSKPPILIDMRNHYESSIGHFEHAIRPDVTTFKENIEAMLDICQGKEDQDIYMYCTGGIRCTRSGALLKSNGFKSVKMLRGGVTAYGQYIKGCTEATAKESELETGTPVDASTPKKVSSIYKGKNFTFDKRLGEPITAEVLAKCHICGTACDTYCNCSNMTCNLLMISCPTCLAKHEGTCGSGSCVEMVRTINEKQKEMEKHHPGMKARPGVKPTHEHRLRVRPEVVLKMREAGHNIMSMNMPLDNFASTPIARVQQDNVLALCFADEASRGAKCYWQAAGGGLPDMTFDNCVTKPTGLSGSKACEQRRQVGISEDVASFVQDMKPSSSYDGASQANSEEIKDVKIDATLTITSRHPKTNTWCGFVSEGALYLRGNGWEDMDIRESVVAALELAEEQLGCSSVHICLEKKQPNLAKLVRTLMYAGFEMVHPDVLDSIDPKYLVLGIEV